MWFPESAQCTLVTMWDPLVQSPLGTEEIFLPLNSHNGKEGESVSLGTSRKWCEAWELAGDKEQNPPSQGCPGYQEPQQAERARGMKSENGEV